MRGQPVEDAEGMAAMTAAWDTLKAEALSRSASATLMKEVGQTWT